MPALPHAATLSLVDLLPIWRMLPLLQSHCLATEAYLPVRRNTFLNTTLHLRYRARQWALTHVGVPAIPQSLPW